MHKSPKVSIIILNWNGLRDTFKCLESIRRMDYPNHETIVVDNASTDGSPDKIERSFPGVTVIRNKENLGYAGGNNTGIWYAMRNDADYIWILNNDILVASDALSLLVSFAMKYPHAGILGPMVLQGDRGRRVHSEGVKVNWELIRKKDRLPVFPFLLIENDKDECEEEASAHNVDAIHGCAFLIRRQVFDAIGYFDTSYFLIHEETDFCLRARKKGFDIFAVPSAKIWHKGEQSFNRAGSGILSYYNVRNELLLITRYAPISLKINAYIKSLLTILIEAKNRRYLKSPKTLGIVDFYLRRYGRCRHKLLATA